MKVLIKIKVLYRGFWGNKEMGVFKLYCFLVLGVCGTVKN